MAEETHLFHIDCDWTGFSDGSGGLEGSGPQIAFGLPTGLGGAPGRTNPEELLMSAVAACYSITYSVLAERRKLPLQRIEIGIDGTVVRQAGGTLKFASMHLTPTITLSGASPEQLGAAEDFAHKAELYCLVSNAIRANVMLSVKPTIVNA